MNDPNKAINVNLSSLLSLKAELIRKQAEVSKAKATRVSVEDFTPNKISSAKSTAKKLNEELEPVKKSNEAIISEYEDPALLEKSQKTLVAKAKYYERMQRSGGNTDENCLVLFHNKQQDDTVPSLRPDVYYNNSSSSSETEDDDDDWVEYTDCLGRTRKCLHKDLENMKKQDKDLADSMPERLDQSKPNWMLDIKGNANHEENDILIGPDPAESIISEDCSMISKHDEMRANWEKKHIENLEKTSVHYQDVFFDEARQHGVGYYAFSTDESERAKQQRELEEARKQTITEQEHRDKLKAQREKIIAERVRAAKNRQRARLGLPPLDESNEEDAQKTEAASKEETKGERRERKRLEKSKRKTEKLAAEQELLRKHHVRPWDKEKDSIGKSEVSPGAELPTDWHYKQERLPMSQEEWNENKRAERNPEFAPVANTIKNSHLMRTSFKSTTFLPPMPPPADVANYQSFNTTKQFQRRSYQIDESNQNEEQQEHTKHMRGAAIPPPVDLDSKDAYQPSHAKKSKSSIDLERSIEAGLRFLRNNSDKNTLSVKSSWTSKADY